MNYSIFPQDESSLFIDIKNLFIDNNTINTNFIFYKINTNLKYPYVTFLLNNRLEFFNTIIDSNNEDDIIQYLNNLNNNLYIFDVSNLKYFFDIHNSNLYVFCLYDKNIDVLNYEKNKGIHEVISYDIINNKYVYELNINDNCYDFFLRHNYLLYVKNHKENIKYPCPTTLYKGTKRNYLNNIVLLGENQFLFKKNYTYTDFNTAKDESSYLYIEDIDYKLVIFNNIIIKNKIKKTNNIIKNNGIHNNGKLIINFKNNLIRDNSEIKIIDINLNQNIVYLKVKNTDFNNSSLGDYIYPFYDKIIDNKNRLILKYIIFIDNLINENSINEIDHIKEYYDLEKIICNSYFKNTKKDNFIFKTTNLNDLYLSEYLNI